MPWRDARSLALEPITARARQPCACCATSNDERATKRSAFAPAPALPLPTTLKGESAEVEVPLQSQGAGRVKGAYFVLAAFRYLKVFAPVSVRPRWRHRPRDRGGYLCHAWKEASAGKMDGASREEEAGARRVPCVLCGIGHRIVLVSMRARSASPATGGCGFISTTDARCAGRLGRALQRETGAPPRESEFALPISIVGLNSGRMDTGAGRPGSWREAPAVLFFPSEAGPLVWEEVRISSAPEPEPEARGDWRLAAEGVAAVVESLLHPDRRSAAEARAAVAGCGGAAARGSAARSRLGAARGRDWRRRARGDGEPTQTPVPASPGREITRSKGMRA